MKEIKKCVSCGNTELIVEKINKELLNIKNDSYTYLCKSCGYLTNTEYYLNSEILLKTINNNILSNILLEFKIFDEENELYWLPMIIVKENGLIIPEYDENNIFKWSVIPIENQSFKLNLKKLFEKNQFLDACKTLGEIII